MAYSKGAWAKLSFILLCFTSHLVCLNLFHFREQPGRNTIRQATEPSELLGNGPGKFSISGEHLTRDPQGSATNPDKHRQQWIQLEWIGFKLNLLCVVLQDELSTLLHRHDVNREHNDICSVRVSRAKTHSHVDKGATECTYGKSWMGCSTSDVISRKTEGIHHRLFAGGRISTQDPKGFRVSFFTKPVPFSWN